MHTVLELSKEVNLPQNRAALALHGASSPANAPGIPEVRKSLNDHRSQQEMHKNCHKKHSQENCRPVPSRFH
ncbi:hypothetical protein BgiMline_026110 [Biomphalaria glabrata]|nr:hypothetical protein BgiMline_031307 [Biomphalaria glabrata]